MNKQALSLAVCIAGAYPLTSGAIGLGDIRSSSHLNQPLNAKIELLSVNTQEAQQIQVKLASVDVFNRVGIDRPAYLNSLKFSSTIQNGKPVILVSSNQPIKEPFLNFLLEVSWPQGQLLKEYTVLLDPPVLMQAASALDNNAASIRAEPKATGFVKRAPENNDNVTPASNPATKQVKLSTPPHLTNKANAPQPATKKSKYRVKSGDTLYKVAARVKTSGVSTDQMMLALFRANPKAFNNGNINSLKAGSTLAVPSTDNAQAIATNTAQQAVRQHYTEWKQFRKKLAGQTVAQQALSTPPSTTVTTQTTSPPPATDTVKAKTAHLEVLGGESESQASQKVAAAGKAQIAQLEKQLSLAQESLLSKKRENTELRSRVTDLQSLVEKKERLITLKNEQLAQLQASILKSGKPVNSNPVKTDTANSSDTPTQSENTAKNSNSANTPIQPEINQPAVDPVAPIDNSRTHSESQPANITPETTDTAKANLTPAQIAEHRRISDLSLNTDNKDDAISPDGFKNEENNLLNLLSSPITAAAGAGAILLLLLAWLLLARRQEKVANDSDLMASLDNFDDTFKTLDDEVTSKGNSTDSKAQSSENFFRNIDNATPEQKNAKSDTALTSASSANNTDDDILQEADVYIVYGLHEQAEAELKKAIKEHPQKLEYRQKLLENYLASDNKTAFDQQAEELNRLQGQNKKQIWDKVTEMGFKINPDNLLYKAAKPADFDPKTTEESKTQTQEANSKPNTQESENSSNAAVPSALTLIDTQTEELSKQNADFSLDSLEKELDTKSVSSQNEDFNLDELEKELDAKSVSKQGEDFSLDKLEQELDTQTDNTNQSKHKSNSDNVIDFESMLNEEEKRSSDNKLSLASLNLNVDSNSGIDRILPKGTPYTNNANDEKNIFSEEEDDILAFLDLPDEDFDLHEAHISTKLELARAYLDMGDIEGARSTLEEVIVEGSDDQKREAEDLLHQTG